MQVTVVVPFGKVEPEAGLHTKVAPGQLSLTVGLKVTTALHWLGSLQTVMFAGHVIDGAWQSFTVTVNEQDRVLPLVSVAVHVTVVVPLAKTEPEAGAQDVVAPGQLSVAVGVV